MIEGCTVCQDVNTCKTCDSNYDLNDDGKCDAHSSAAAIVIVCIVAAIVAVASIGKNVPIQPTSFSGR